MHRPRWHLLRQGLLALRRDWRAGELRLLGAALALAVAAVCSVDFLADRVHQALQQDSAQIMGGDLLVQADAAIPTIWVEQAQRMGLESTQTLQFPTCATRGVESRIQYLSLAWTVARGTRRPGDN